MADAVNGRFCQAGLAQIMLLLRSVHRGKRRAKLAKSSFQGVTCCYCAI
jgi:hypothetical protein